MKKRLLPFLFALCALAFAVGWVHAVFYAEPAIPTGWLIAWKAFCGTLLGFSAVVYAASAVIMWRLRHEKT